MALQRHALLRFWAWHLVHFLLSVESPVCNSHKVIFFMSSMACYSCSNYIISFNGPQVLTLFFQHVLKAVLRKSYGDFLLSKLISSFINICNVLRWFRWYRPSEFLFFAILVSVEPCILGPWGIIWHGIWISGLAVGLAAKEVVGNMFGGASLFLTRPFVIGEKIKVKTLCFWLASKWKPRPNISLFQSPLTKWWIILFGGFRSS